jgi:hypothetical protein
MLGVNIVRRDSPTLAKEWEFSVKGYGADAVERATTEGWPCAYKERLEYSTKYDGFVIPGGVRTRLEPDGKTYVYEDAYGSLRQNGKYLTMETFEPELRWRVTANAVVAVAITLAAMAIFEYLIRRREARKP